MLESRFVSRELPGLVRGHMAGRAWVWARPRLQRPSPIYSEDSQENKKQDTLWAEKVAYDDVGNKRKMESLSLVHATTARISAQRETSQFMIYILLAIQESTGWVAVYD